MPARRFGTVRPRVQISGPRPFLYSKSAISGRRPEMRITAGSQFPGGVTNRAVLQWLRERNLNSLGSSRCLVSADANGRTVRHPLRKSHAGVPNDAQHRTVRPRFKVRAADSFRPKDSLVEPESCFVLRL